MRQVLWLAGLAAVLCGCSGTPGVDRAVFGSYDAAFVMHDRSTGEVVDVNPELGARRLPPCSTFKIYNTLIGLELGLVPGADGVWWRWDGVRRSYEAWNRDLSLREAFRASCVPAYQALAREVGPERMRSFVERMHYGTEDISSGIDIFWLPKPGSKPILISATEQVALLDKLLDGRLPFAQRNVVVLRDVMTAMKTAKGTLYGKTGTDFDAAGRGILGWYVGFVESEGRTYTFACNLTGGTDATGKTAREMVEKVLRGRGLL